MKLVEGELEILNETNNVEGRKIRGVEMGWEIWDFRLLVCNKIGTRV